MRLSSIANRFARQFAGWIDLSNTGSEFHCSDLERQKQCGLPPHDDCVITVEQIARSAEAPYLRKVISSAVWPPTKSTFDLWNGPNLLLEDFHEKVRWHSGDRSNEETCCRLGQAMGEHRHEPQ
jgi:hypothetical protein